MAFFVNALVVGTDSGDPVAVEEKLGTGESGEDCDPGLFHLAAQPFHKAIERDNVIAVVAQRRRSDRQFELALLGEEINRLFLHFRVERSFLLEIRQQLANAPRIEQCTRKAVLPNLARLLEHVNIFFAELRVWMSCVVRVNQLCQTQSTSHPSRPAAHDDHIRRHLRALHAFNGFAEN